MNKITLLYSAIALTTVRASAQAIRTFTAVNDLTINGATSQLSHAGWVGVDRKGGLIVTQPVAKTIKFFSPAGALTGTIGKEGEGIGEFQDVGQTTWRGDTLVIGDNRLRRLTLISPDHRVARTIPAAFDMTTPSGDPVSGNAGLPPGSQPVIMPEISSVFADGSFLALASLPTTLSVPSTWRRPGEAKMGYVQVAANGLIKSVVAWVPAPPPCSNPLQFCPRPAAASAADGHAIGIANGITTGPDSGTLRVVVLNPKGDTSLARSYKFVGIPIPQSYVDSVNDAAAKRRAARGNSAPVAPPAYTPTIFPPVTALVFGRDGTIWVGEESVNGSRHWLILSATGDVLGQTSIPSAVSVRTADANTAWGIEFLAGQGTENIVRYRVQH